MCGILHLYSTHSQYIENIAQHQGRAAVALNSTFALIDRVILVAIHETESPPKIGFTKTYRHTIPPTILIDPYDILHDVKLNLQDNLNNVECLKFFLKVVNIPFPNVVLC